MSGLFAFLQLFCHIKILVDHSNEKLNEDDYRQFRLLLAARHGRMELTICEQKPY